MCQEENVSGISCEKTKQNQTLEEMIDKGKVSDHKSSEAKKRGKEEKAAAKEHRKSPIKCLQQTKKRKIEDM